MKCSYCKVFKSQYNVIPPLCVQNQLGLEVARLCPLCFQDGITVGEIVWLGDKPYGICADCEREERATTAEAG